MYYVIYYLISTNQVQKQRMRNVYKVDAVDNKNIMNSYWTYRIDTQVLAVAVALPTAVVATMVALMKQKVWNVTVLVRGMVLIQHHLQYQ